MRRILLATTGVVAMVGCWSSELQLRTKAAADFQCNADQLTVNEVKPDVYEVSGCDNKERYVYNDAARAWIKESESGGTVVQPPP